MKRIAIAVAIASAIAVLSGCASRNAANASNFAAAINRYYSGAKACVVAPFKDNNVRFSHGSFPINAPTNGERRQVLLGAMVRAGILRVVGHKEEPFYLLTEPYTLYAPTPAYKGKLVIGGEKNNFLGHPGLCAAHIKVHKVLNFKKLSGAAAELTGGGSQSYEVKYSFIGVPTAWARVPAVAKVMRSLGGPTGAKVHTNGDDGVNMTHNGWRVFGN